MIGESIIGRDGNTRDNAWRLFVTNTTLECPKPNHILMSSQTDRPEQYLGMKNTD